MDEQTYIKNFNRGYQLAKYEPVLFTQIIKSNDDKVSIIAMKEGAKEAEREKFRENLKAVKDNNAKDRDKDKDLD